MTKMTILTSMVSETDVNKLRILRDQYDLLVIASRGCLDNISNAARNIETYKRILKMGEDIDIDDKITDMNTTITNETATLNTL